MKNISILGKPWLVVLGILAFHQAQAGDRLKFSAEEARIPYPGRESALFLGPTLLPDLDPNKSVCESFKDRFVEQEAVWKKMLGEGSKLEQAEAHRKLVGLYIGNERLIPRAEELLSEAVKLTEGSALAGEYLALRGMLRLRMGELKNCLENHNADSCIFPLSKKAVHADKFWTLQAIEDFQKALVLDPGNIHLRWLLNVAHMAAGSYPAKVPKKLLVPKKTLRGEAAFARFRDLAAEAGLHTKSMGGGGAMLEDLDGDGLLDAILGSRLPCLEMLVYRNEGNGKFSPWNGFSDQRWVTNVAQADVNNDGKIDLYLSRGGWFGNIYPSARAKNTLLVNQGGGQFVDESAKYSIDQRKSFNVSAQWVDFDLDGWVDLFVCNENRTVDLFRNRGGKGFEEVAGKLGLRNQGICKGSAWADVNGDGYPDVVMANYGSENRFFLNEGGTKFREQKISGLNQDPTLAFSAFFFDYDNDGRPDLFLGGYNRDVEVWLYSFLGLPQKKPFDTHHLFRNTSEGNEVSFEDVTKSVGLDMPALSMGSNFGDLDNDGFLDIFTGTGSISYGDLVPNQVFRNRAGQRFEEVTSAGGFGNLQKGHGASFGDVNRDGRAEIFVNFGGSFGGDAFFPALYAGPSFGADWLNLSLEGKESNRAAIGAVVEVRVKNGKKVRSLFRTVGATSSFGGNPLELLIGLGKGAIVESVTVRWPRKGAIPVKFSNISKNGHWKIVEGEGARRLERKPFTLGQRKATGMHQHH